jgi:hypothetical protein
MRVSKLGLDPQVVYKQVLSGIPAYDGPRGVDPLVVERLLYSAEDRVESDTDMLIKPRMIYCVQDRNFEPPEPDAIVKSALTIPANWFAGNRNGYTPLPNSPVRQIHRLSVVANNYSNRRIEIQVNAPNSPIRLKQNALWLRPNFLWQNIVDSIGSWSGGGDTTSGLGMYAANSNQFGAGGRHRWEAGRAIPAGLEVVFEAGLTKREIENDYYPLISMVYIQTQIGVLTELQQRVGGNGAQEETLQVDAMTNTIKFPDRSKAGVFGGELKALGAQYDQLLRSMLSKKAITLTMMQ